MLPFWNSAHTPKVDVEPRRSPEVGGQEEVQGWAASSIKAPSSVPVALATPPRSEAVTLTFT